MVHFVALNDGTALAGNTLFRLIVLNEGAGLHGIQISGVHSIQDLRGVGRRKRRRQAIETFPIDVYGRVFTRSGIETASRIQKTASIKTISKLLDTRVPKASGKVYRNSLLEIQSKVMILQHRIKEAKKKEVKKLFDAYKEEFNE